MVIWVLKKKKSAGAISSEYGGGSMIFVEFLVRNSITMIALWDGVSELVDRQRVLCTKNHLEWPVTISFTLAMLTSVEDVDGRPERGNLPPHLDRF